ncbi:MAG TPA: aminotransferase class I/II-fold pyridoxal phosphate-dependent enzyme [Streptosporangiaceae bacterium]|nr:aminotransferase class I/II-fold pyridoxal phosphate-dependent enzyme [Streptosporangiaceae bacterium]
MKNSGGQGVIADLRSEAVAPLNPLVRQALAAAPDGSDSYDEDAAVLDLEERLKAMFGMRTALFVPTGRLANTLAVGILGGLNSEILCELNAHMVRSEYGLSARLWGIQTRTFSSDHGRVAPENVLPLLRQLENTTVRTTLVCVEDTHTMEGGAAQDTDALRAVATLLKERRIQFYCDGARLWYANVRHRVPWTFYGEIYDGISVSLVKGVGAPVGAALLLRENRRSELRDLRRMAGGAWIRPGPLASAALCALDANRDDARTDCANAALLADHIRSGCPGLEVRQETNMVMFDVPDASDYFERCRAAGVMVFRFTPSRIRAVTHRGISRDDIDRAAKLMCAVYREVS